MRITVNATGVANGSEVLGKTLYAPTAILMMYRYYNRFLVRSCNFSFSCSVTRMKPLVVNEFKSQGDYQ